MRNTFSLFFLLSYFMLIQCDLEGEQVGENLKHEIPTWHQNCVILSDVTEEDIIALRKGKFEDEDNEAVKKYFSCIILESKAMDANFKVNMTLVDYYLPKQISDDVFPTYLTCAKEARELDASFEDKAWSFFKCFYDSDPEHFILP
uniref:Odorant-binding protein 30 n=1 Tax=Pyrrhalta aenescens TaxID=281545 RepID=A0A1J0KKY0_9CUCU|nr:odorant-binding protein 30 [Pyrrhalta aenescens]